MELTPAQMEAARELSAAIGAPVLIVEIETVEITEP
jgi:hypothetical protein